MVPVPSSLNQATSYAMQHANNVNADDFYIIFIGAPCSCCISQTSSPHLCIP